MASFRPHRPASAPRGAVLATLATRGGLVALVLVLLLGLGLVATHPDPARASGGEELVEGVAAQVGSDIVLVSEVLELSAPVEERMRQAGAPEREVARVRQEALERLIETRLLSSVVERLELGATREEVDSAIQAIAEENGLTLEQLLASVSSHGLAVEEYRGKIRDEIERSKVVNAMVRSRVEVTEEEIRAAYEERFADQRQAGGEEFYVRHIVALTQGGPERRTPEEACALVEEARRRITTGEVDFGRAAQRVSDMNRERGGDLGWLHEDELAPWMKRRLEEMEAGELSPVIELRFGCNLLQLVERREYRPVSFAQAEPQIRQMLMQRKTETAYTDWLGVLRQQVYIERKGAFRDDALDG